MALIHEKICAIMADMPAIGKNSRNEQQKFNFRGIDDVMNVLKPLMVKHQVFACPVVIGERYEDLTTKNGAIMHRVVLKVTYYYYAADGSHIECTTYGEGMDSGDKATSKAMSIAMKYAHFQVFCIPTEEMTEMDTAYHDPDFETQPEQVIVCENCKKPIEGVKTSSGKTLTPDEVEVLAKKKFGKSLCYHCCIEANRAAV